MEPREFGKYTLLERVGKGGVGSVYRATNQGTDEIVAVKIFECLADRPADVTRKLRNREVRMLLSVQHPNIVQFRETGEVGDDHYYTMEFVERSLLERMRDEDNLALLDKVHLLRQTANALAAVHHQAIVHRDVKPGNILLDVDPSGTPHAKLTDLGIAINVSETDIIQEQRRGGIPGTPKYLSPEQIRQEHLDGRADIFSLGVVAYELLTQNLPFKADKADDYLIANVEQTPRPPKEVCDDLPEFLSDMVVRMLARDREERYDSDTLARDLQLAEQHLVSGASLVERINTSSLFYEPLAEPEQPRRRIPRIAPLSWALALIMLLAGGATAWLARPHGAPRRATASAPETPRDPAALIEQAASAAAAGRHWQATLILEQVSPGGLSPEAQRKLENLTAVVHAALAQETYATADHMLQQDRDAEADVVLMRMKDAYPESQWTGRLEAALQERRQRLTDTQRWDRAMARTYDLVRRRLYADALAERRRLLEDFADEPAKVEQARQAIGDLLQSWGLFLLQGNPPSDKIEEFLNALEESSQPAAARVAAQVKAGLHLKLGAKYEAASDYAGAMKEYDLAVNLGDPETSTKARNAYDRLHTRIMETPIEAQAFTKDLAESGFGSALWEARTDARGQQSLADGVLTMRVAAGEGDCMVSRSTARPLRNLGFSAAVQFRMPQPAPAAQSGARAGIAIMDAGGNGYDLFFDAAAYSFYRRTRGSVLGNKLRDAFGDEQTAWHTLQIRYVFDTGRLSMLLDGQVLEGQSVSISDVRITMLLEAESGAAGAVEFRDFTYTP